MKKRFARILAAVLALITALSCSSALATVEEYHAWLDRMVDPDNPAAFTITTLQTGTLVPPDTYSPRTLVSILHLVDLRAVDMAEIPDGQFVVLEFPEDHIRFDFMLGHPERNYIRQVNPDGSEELFRGEMPDDVLVDASEVIEAEAGILMSRQEAGKHVEMNMAEDGWVAESLAGETWEDDDAMLSVSFDGESNAYLVYVIWAASEHEGREWLFRCEYDEEETMLVSWYVVYNAVIFDDNDDMIRTSLYDGSDETYFFVNDDGELEIEDPQEGLLDGKVFVMKDLEQTEDGE